MFSLQNLLNRQLKRKERFLLKRYVLEIQTVCKKHIPAIPTQHIVMLDILLFHNTACNNISEKHLQLPQSAKFCNFAMILRLYNKCSLKCCYYITTYVFLNPFTFSPLHSWNDYLDALSWISLFSKVNFKCVNLCYTFSEKTKEYILNSLFSLWLNALNSDAPLQDSTKVIKGAKRLNSKSYSKSCQYIDKYRSYCQPTLTDYSYSYCSL